MKNDNLIVGIDTSDDAAVYKMNDELATIQTLDFFTPVVDDPYTFGQIAAANSLSDIYAMGGKPILALNIVCFPNCLPIEILGEILQGGADKVMEAGAVVVGGHSVQDDEPKYGLSVTGIVHPLRVFKNYGAELGDVLILTKPLGTGIINTAIKGEMASKGAYDKVVKVMTTLNKYSGEIIQKYDISSCTDITGFGFMGHAFEMASSSNKTFKIFKDQISYIEEAREYACWGLIPGGTYRNKEHLKGKYLLNMVEEWMADILFDPQTSGGLLFTCRREVGQKIFKELSALELKSNIVGEVLEKGQYYLVVE
ncbi:selenide, water dikinase [Clostridium polyendosporum]|uniref:Selenide, water dikinase n=2 Tax=Clostridium polyendosporum TaxID=69208 RepID=A0A919RZL0_9CLOT|nr:selenide, water dikinase [Clostridium polyendosporum]